MTAVIDRMTEVQDKIISVISDTKAPVADAVSTVVGYVVDRVPTVPAVPFADQIPTPKELIDNQYKFAKSIIDTNKDIALSVAKAAAPLTDLVLDRKTPVARKVAAKKAS